MFDLLTFWSKLKQRKVPVRGSKKESRVVCDYNYDNDYEFVYGGEEPVKGVKIEVKSKAVDEDLYKISPELLRAPPRRVIFRSLTLT